MALNNVQEIKYKPPVWHKIFLPGAVFFAVFAIQSFVTRNSLEGLAYDRRIRVVILLAMFTALEIWAHFALSVFIRLDSDGLLYRRKGIFKSIEMVVSYGEISDVYWSALNGVVIVLKDTRKIKLPWQLVRESGEPVKERPDLLRPQAPTHRAGYWLFCDLHNRLDASRAEQSG